LRADRLAKPAKTSTSNSAQPPTISPSQSSSRTTFSLEARKARVRLHLAGLERTTTVRRLHLPGTKHCTRKRLSSRPCQRRFRRRRLQLPPAPGLACRPLARAPHRDTLRRVRRTPRPRPRLNLRRDPNPIANVTYFTVDDGPFGSKFGDFFEAASHNKKRSFLTHLAQEVKSTKVAVNRVRASSSSL
jgi:hypothetical protein